MHSLQDDPPAGVMGAPTDNNIMLWNAVIFGPADTPFEDGALGGGCEYFLKVCLSRLWNTVIFILPFEDGALGEGCEYFLKVCLSLACGIRSFLALRILLLKMVRFVKNLSRAL